MTERLERRDFLLATTAALGSAIAACHRAPPPPSSTASTHVRLASVPTAVEGGILPTLLADFEASHGAKVELTVATKDVYDLARNGQCDLILSHYGHKQAEAFVMDGFGEWPRTVFSNQTALLGPPSDPAGIRGVTDAVEAFARIAKARAPFIVNDLDGQRYVAEILWNAAGMPDRTGWFLDDGTAREDALSVAVKKQGYVLWGITPFERSQKANERALEPLVYADPLLQRLMVTIVVRPEKIATVNAEGARALQGFLLAAATQAKMRSIRYPGVEHAVWAPAGRNNRYAILPRG